MKIGTDVEEVVARFNVLYLHLFPKPLKTSSRITKSEGFQYVNFSVLIIMISLSVGILNDVLSTAYVRR
jgi:hypothetical protein